MKQDVNLKEWRKRHGYSQQSLMLELGIRSRQTISTWDNAKNDELPRMLQLALTALEMIPECRRVTGKQASAAENKAMKRSPGFQRDAEQ